MSAPIQALQPAKASLLQKAGLSQELHYLELGARFSPDTTVYIRRLDHPQSIANHDQSRMQDSQRLAMATMQARKVPHSLQPTGRRLVQSGTLDSSIVPSHSPQTPLEAERHR